jgi:hypothetical protein
VRLVHGQVLERLLEESGRSNHFETFWLEHRIARNRDGD